MPARINPRDWDRLFRQGAPQRGGPLRALANILIFGVVIALLGGGLIFGLRFASERSRAITATEIAQATIAAETAFAVRTADALSAATATAAIATTPTADVLAGVVGVGQVVQAGNLRRDTQLVPETVLGQICIGDAVAFLDERIVANITWYRIRVTSTSANCDPTRVAVGTEGWASSQLLSPPAVATPSP